MKILTVSLHNDVYGAGRAAYRLHSGLYSQPGCEAQMLVGIRQQPDATVQECFRGNLKKTLFQIGIKLNQLPMKFYRPDKNYFFSADWLGHDIHKTINRINPDVVHIHWINHGFMSLKAFAALKMPIVLSCHDMWYFTGGCHYDEHCNGFVHGCGNCPALTSNRKKDLSYHQFQQKLKTYRQLGQKLTVVGLSRWMQQSAQQSNLFSHNAVVHLPNGIDTDLFKPIEKKVARHLLNLPQAEPLLLFGAVDATSDSRKGYQHLKEAFGLMRNTPSLMIFGDQRNSTKRVDSRRFKEYHLGNIRDEQTLMLIYNAADITLLPSRQENLPNVVMESMACGTPVVAFNVGGNADMIEHNHNGYLAEPFVPEELAKGMDLLLDDPMLCSTMGSRARQKIESGFNIQSVSEQYMRLYQSITGRRK